MSLEPSIAAELDFDVIPREHVAGLIQAECMSLLIAVCAANKETVVAEVAEVKADVAKLKLAESAAETRVTRLESAIYTR